MQNKRLHIIIMLVVAAVILHPIISSGFEKIVLKKGVLYYTGVPVDQAQKLSRKLKALFGDDIPAAWLEQMGDTLKFKVIVSNGLEKNSDKLLKSCKGALKKVLGDKQCSIVFCDDNWKVLPGTAEHLLRKETAPVETPELRLPDKILVHPSVAEEVPVPPEPVIVAETIIEGEPRPEPVIIEEAIETAEATIEPDDLPVEPVVMKGPSTSKLYIDAVFLVIQKQSLEYGKEVGPLRNDRKLLLYAWGNTTRKMSERLSTISAEKNMDPRLLKLKTALQEQAGKCADMLIKPDADDNLEQILKESDKLDAIQREWGVVVQEISGN